MKPRLADAGPAQLRRMLVGILGLTFPLVTLQFLHAAESPAAAPKPPAVVRAAVEGSLPNGLRYVLLPHRRELERVSVRLVVHAGSLDEREGERGFAHFVEHLAFEGSRHFPPGKVRELFQSLGLADGADLNAHTSHTYTTFRIDLPVGRSGRLDDVLRVMRDFADGLEFPESEVTRERGVVLAEAAARDNDDLQVMRQRTAALFPGTALADRFPIGERADLERATAATLRAFYRRCYSPRRMTLVIVGDIEPSAATPLLTRHFASMRADRSAAAQVLPDMPPSPGKLQPHVITSSNALAANAAFIVVAPRTGGSTEEARKDFVRSLAVSLLNARFRALRTRDPQRIGIAAASGDGAIDQRFLLFTAEASAASDDWEHALALVESGLRRAITEGFSPAEFAEQIGTTLAWARAAVEVFAGSPADSIATEIATAIAAGGTWRHPAELAAQATEFAATVTPAEAAAALGTLFAERFAHVNIFRRTPPAGGADAVAAAWSACTRRPLDPAPPPAPPLEFRYNHAATPGTVATRRSENDLGIELVTFGNGAHLNLRASRSEPGRFRLAARLGRGLVDFSPERPGLGHIAAHLLREADLRRHTRDEINRLLHMRALTAHATFDHRYLVMIAGPVSELPFALRVLAAELSDTKLDPARFNEALSDTAGCRAAQLENGDDHAREGIIALMAGGDPRLREPPPTAIGDYTYAEVAAWLRAHWLDGPLEIALVGDLDLSAAIAAAAATLGALPRQRELIDTSAARPTLRAAPTQQTEKVTLADATAAVRLAWPVPDARNPAAIHALHLASDVLVDRVHRELRHELGATYSPTGSLETLPQHHSFAFVSIALTFPPTRASELTRRAITLAGELAKDGITTEEFARLREPLRTSAIENLRSNEWWIGEILAHAQSDPAVLAGARALPGAYDRLTREEVNRAAATHFGPDQASSLIIKPIAPDAPTEDQVPTTAADFIARGQARAARGETAAAMADFNRALEIDARNDNALVARGAMRIQLGEIDGGIADTTRALELNPRNGLAYVNRAAAKLALGAVDAVLADCTKALELDPTLALAYANRAAAHLGRGEFDRSIADATKALELNPRDAIAFTTRGTAHANKGDRVRAIADCTRAIEFNPQHVDAWQNRGLLRYEEGNVESAIEDLDRAIALNPSAIVSLRARGIIYVRKQRLAAALADLEKVLALAPDDELALLNRGIVLQQQGDLDRALADVEHLLRVSPKNVDAYNNRGFIRQLKRDYAGAIADFNQAIELNPNFALAYNNRGHTKRLMGDAMGALDDLEKGHRLAAPPTPRADAAPPKTTPPTPPPVSAEALALVRSADTKRSQRKLDEAIADYTAALKLAPDHLPALLGRGFAHDAKQDYARSLPDFDRVIQLNPKSAEAHNGRGYAHAGRGNFQAAIADYDRALQLSPRFPAPLNNRGIARRALGDLSGSLVDLDAALKLSPGYTSAYSQRAITKHALGDYAGALADYDTYLGKSPSSTYQYLYRFACVPAANRAAARAELAKLVSSWPEGWPKNLGRYATDELDAETLLRLAGQATGRLGETRPCEAHWLIGVNELAAGRTESAREHFRSATKRALPQLTAYQLARAELARLDPKP